MTPLLATHAFAATVALLLGAWQIFFSRKGSPVHRLVGRTWVALAVFVSVGSFWIQELRPGQYSFFHVLSVVTLVTTTLGVVAAVRGNIHSHRGNMTGTWIGFCVAFTLAVAVPDRHIQTYAVDSPAAFGLAVVAVLVTTVAVLLVARLIERLTGRPALLASSPRSPS
jgi:uncharacterized membrane protein